ncbi:fibronectin type III domain-containing protein [Dokdonella sp.]|uniref:fibronectin type III domain-containing protein n=1 Tax=Dokdonella sp. TaxID=2291710 RepID=UPI002F3F0B24
MLKYRYLTAVLALASGVAAAAAGAAAPAGFGAGFKSIDEVATARYGALDLKRIAEEDALREAAGNPMRFAIAHDSGIDVRTGGTWEQKGDRSIWRYRVQAQDAASLNFGFTRFHVPASARVYIYASKDHAQLAGPYDATSHNALGQLWTPIIASADVMVELDVATSERDQVDLVLGKINQGYRGFGTHAKGYQQPGIHVAGEGKSACSPDAIQSGACNMDVACMDASDPWNNPRRSVGAYTIAGTDTCTGSLVNNTANDRSMLFITASHCNVVANPAGIVVYWNYESATCRTPGSAQSGVPVPRPTTTSSGSTFLARTRNPFSGSDCTNGAVCSDNTLVRLNGTPDPAWNLYWAGWDHGATAATCVPGSNPNSDTGQCASIHHPNVDEKRITFVEQNFEVGGIAGGTNTHWHAFWDPTPPILPNIPAPQPSSLPPGVTEPGSSGSPLYNASQRLVGVLSGGPSACGATGANLSDFYGQLSVAWEGEGTPATRMKDWLDPTSSGATAIDGIGTTPFNFTLDPTSVSACVTSDTATVNLAATYDVGFSGTVSFTAASNPPGVGSTFAPPSLTPPANASVLTLDGISSLAPGSFFTILVSGTSGADTVSKSLPLTVAGPLSGSVSLLTPADGATGVSTGTTLTWDALAGAASYTVEVATDPGFTNIVATQSGITTTSYATSGLNPNTTYYWHVKATNGCGDGTFSAAFSFTTANLICHSLSLAIPDNNPTGVNDTITLSDASMVNSLKLSIKATHTYVGDLKFTLSKDAASSAVIDRPGYTGTGFGCGNNDIDVVLDDAATSPVEDACSATPPAIGGTLSPNAPGLAPFAGLSLAGTWTLNVSDNASADTGTLTEWCLLPELAIDDTIFADGFELIVR